MSWIDRLACKGTVQASAAFVICDSLLPNRHKLVLVLLFQTWEGCAILDEALEQVAAVSRCCFCRIELALHAVRHD